MTVARGRGRRGWRWWWPQLALLAVLAALLCWLGANLAANMERRGLAIGFGFLRGSARFPLSESLLRFDPTDSMARAFAAGVGNTILLAALVILLSTLSGIPLALAARSRHRPARALARAVIEPVRNTPLVVQMLFCYGLLTIGLPSPRAAWQPLAGVFLTNRGVYLTRWDSALPLGALLMAGACVTAVLAWRGRLHGGRVVVLLTGWAAVLLVAGLLAGLSPDRPRLGRFNYVGGAVVSPEFGAVLLASVIYAGAFAAEIIRAGIDAVARGQWEAGAALGLSERQTLRLVVMPQALKVIVPPMTTHFIGILKNVTVALVVGYPEANSVTNTIVNHSGQALEGLAMLAIAYLLLAGAISIAMGRLNARVQAVGR